MILTFSWPPKELSPNSRTHWAPKARATKAYKAACIQECWAHGLGKVRKDTWGFSLHLTFCPPSNRGHDLDNLVSSSKALIDAIAHVIDVNDKEFQISQEKAAPVKGGKVVVNLLWSSPRSPSHATQLEKIP